jgi:hypothetical protein
MTKLNYLSEYGSTVLFLHTIHPSTGQLLEVVTVHLTIRNIYSQGL